MSLQKCSYWLWFLADQPFRAVELEKKKKKKKFLYHLLPCNLLTKEKEVLGGKKNGNVPRFLCCAFTGAVFALGSFYQ